MEGSRNFKEPQEKRIIIDDLAQYEEEIGVGRGIRRQGGFGEFLKNIFVGLLLIGIVVGSFWVSFLIGKRVLVPVKQLETREAPPMIEERIPEDEMPVLITSESAPQVEEKAVPSKRIEVKTATPPEKMMYYKVQAGIFTTKAEAENVVSLLKAKGTTSFVRKVSGDAWRVQVGAYRTRSQAQTQVKSLKAKGIETTIIYE